MREPTLIAAVGMPGVGKTYRNLIEIKKVLFGNPQKGVRPRKVLIIDNNNEYRNDNKDVQAILGSSGIYIKTIHPTDVAKFGSSKIIELCRIIPFTDRGAPMSLKEFADTLNFILTYFSDGLLIAEDFKAYTGNSLNQELMGKLATRRHSGCDTLLSLQGMGMIVPALWTNLKWVRLHKTTDPLERSDGKFKGQIQFLTLAEKIVSHRYRSGDERAFVHIDLLKGRVYGNYTEQEFDFAAQQYIFENWSKTGGLLMKHLDLDTGKAKYNKHKALNKYLTDLRNDFSQYTVLPKK